MLDDGTASPFDAGNQWLSLNSAANGAFTFGNLNFTPQTVGTVSFDAYFDQALFHDKEARIRARGQGPGGTPNNLYLQDIGYQAQENAFVPSADTAEHYDIIFNTTTSASGALAANTMEVWVDGVFVTSNSTVTDATGVGRMTLWSQNTAGTQSSSYIDNIEVRDEVYVVPEPASLVLIGMGGLAMLRRRG